MKTPPRPEKLVIEGPAGPLEAVAEDPRAPAPPAFAVVCHPHPLHGGAYTNKVVHTLARTLQEVGLPTVRFNFRGVGASAGSFDEGNGETLDALAVVEYGRRRWPGVPLWLGGFSFGGYVALRAASQAGAQRLITVAPAITRHFTTAADLPSPDCPWLIVIGAADELVDAQELRALVAGSRREPRLAVLPGVDHYFGGRLHELKDAILEGLS